MSFGYSVRSCLTAGWNREQYGHWISENSISVTLAFSGPMAWSLTETAGGWPVGVGSAGAGVGAVGAATAWLVLVGAKMFEHSPFIMMPSKMKKPTANITPNPPSNPRLNDAFESIFSKKFIKTLLKRNSLQRSSLGLMVNKRRLNYDNMDVKRLSTAGLANHK